MTDASTNTIAFHISEARRVLAKRPLRKWPDITAFRSKISIVKRIIKTNTLMEKMEGSHLTKDGKYVARYQRLKIENVLLATKAVLAYPGINAPSFPHAQAVILGASIKMDDVFYERGHTADDRAADKKAQLIKVLTLSYVEIVSVLNHKERR